MKNPDRQRRTTFRARLTGAIALLCLGVLALASAAIYLGARHALYTSLDQALHSIARAEIASAVDEPGGRIHVHEDRQLPLDLASGAGYEKFAQIEDEEDRIVAQTANLKQGPVLPSDPAQERRARSGEVTFSDLRRAGQEYRAIYYPLRGPDGRSLLAVVAVSKQPIQQTLHLLLGALGFALVLGAGATAWGADAQARRLTRPLEAIATAARTVGETSLSTRVPDAVDVVELHDVATVLNEMLERLEASFRSQQQVIAAQRRFVADASHELRSPLNNLRGTVEVTLRRPRAPEDYRQALETSRVEIERICRLVEDLLTLSRVDAGQFVIEPAPCDLVRMALDAAAALAARADAAGVRLCVEADAPVVVCGDRDRLRQVLDNLLDNALRHAPAGSAVVITAQRDGAQARLTVRDQGPGLSLEDQPRIFERFYRADRSRSRQSGGLGLGLAIARAIAEAHQGDLSVESHPGQGATFSLRLPAPVEPQTDWHRLLGAPGQSSFSSRGTPAARTPGDTT